MQFLFGRRGKKKPVVSAVADYFVDATSGSDLNPGTQAQPWQTIAKVNATTLTAGKKVAFKAGQVFVGSLIAAVSGASLASPATYTSYGTGKATISTTVAANRGFYSLNQAGITLKDLIFTGAGTLTSTADGVVFENNQAGNTKLQGITVDNVEISGFGINGLRFRGLNGRSGYDTVTIQNNDIHDCTGNTSGGSGAAGIIFGGGYGQAAVGGASFTNVNVINNKVYNHKGKNGTTNWVGSGILLGQCDGGLVTLNEAYNCGQFNNYSGGGPVGIWCYDSINLIFRSNRSHDNKSASYDGGGFDCDGGCRNCLFEFNYSWNNVGAGYMAYDYSDPGFMLQSANNTFRWNISENDGIGPNGYSGINIGSDSPLAMLNLNVHNNTVYAGASSTGALTIRGGNISGCTARIANNIFIASAGKKLISVFDAGSLPNFTLRSNVLWPLGTFSADWPGGNYTSLTAWSSASAQTGNLSVDPLLSAAPAGGTTSSDLTTLVGYKLQPASTLYHLGVDLLATYSLNPGTKDFFGTTLSGGSTIGASQTQGAAGTVTTTYATLDPANKDSLITLSPGNLTATNGAPNGNYAGIRSNQPITGKRVVEWSLPGATGADLAAIGVIGSDYRLQSSGFTAATGMNILVYNDDGIYGTGGVSIVTDLGWNSASDIFMAAIDEPARKVWYLGPSGLWNNDVLANQNPATGVGGITIPAGTIYFGGVILYQGVGCLVNFGATAFSRTAPAGFTGLSTTSGGGGAPATNLIPPSSDFTQWGDYSGGGVVTRGNGYFYFEANGSGQKVEYYTVSLAAGQYTMVADLNPRAGAGLLQMCMRSNNTDVDYAIPAMTAGQNNHVTHTFTLSSTQVVSFAFKPGDAAGGTWDSTLVAVYSGASDLSAGAGSGGTTTPAAGTTPISGALLAAAGQPTLDPRTYDTDATIKTGAIAGTFIRSFAYSPLALGETINSILPNDGKLVRDATNRQLRCGSTPTTSGTTVYTLGRSGGGTFTFALTAVPGALRSTYGRDRDWWTRNYRNWLGISSPALSPHGAYDNSLSNQYVEAINFEIGAPNFRGLRFFTAPLCTSQTTIEAAAAGSMDSLWQASFAKILANDEGGGLGHQPIIYVRPGCEANLYTWAWSAIRNGQTSRDAYKAAFARYADAIRAYDTLGRVKLVFCPSASLNTDSAEQFMPDPSKFDVLGTDLYHEPLFGYSQDPATALTQAINCTNGPAWVTQRANELGKGKCIPELGNNTEGMGLWIKGIHDYCDTNDYLYVTWWESQGAYLSEFAYGYDEGLHIGDQVPGTPYGDVANKQGNMPRNGAMYRHVANPEMYPEDPLARPAPPAVVAVPRNGSVDLYLTPGVAGTAGATLDYVLYFDSAPGAAFTPTGGKFTVTGVANDAAHTYSVAARNTAGIGFPSNKQTASASSDATVPAVNFGATGEANASSTAGLNGAGTTAINVEIVFSPSASDLVESGDIRNLFGIWGTTGYLTSFIFGLNGTSSAIWLQCHDNSGNDGCAIFDITTPLQAGHAYKLTASMNPGTGIWTASLGPASGSQVALTKTGGFGSLTTSIGFASPDPSLGNLPPRLMMGNSVMGLRQFHGSIRSVKASLGAVEKVNTTASASALVDTQGITWSLAGGAIVA